MDSTYPPTFLLTFLSQKTWRMRMQCVPGLHLRRPWDEANEQLVMELKESDPIKRTSSEPVSDISAATTLLMYTELKAVCSSIQFSGIIPGSTKCEIVCCLNNKGFAQTFCLHISNLYFELCNMPFLPMFVTYQAPLFISHVLNKIRETGGEATLCSQLHYSTNYRKSRNFCVKNISWSKFSCK